MIYPRLKLARNLLTDDGVIFISIDDNEFSNLKKICDEIFNESNYVGNFIRKTVTQRAMAKNYNTQHEYCFIYAKDISFFDLMGDEKDFQGYSNPDNDLNGDWKSVDPTIKGSNNLFEIKNPFTGKVDLPPKGRGWGFKESQIENLVNSKQLVFKETHGENERGFFLKHYKKNLKSKFLLINSLDTCNNSYLNQISTKELNEDFDFQIFDYAKPSAFIKKILSCSKSKNFIILDFFSGSSTTSDAIMRLNAEDNGKRCFIMVQIPEEVDSSTSAFKNGLKTLSDIGKERIKVIGEKIQNNSIYDLDIGFKVFKLDSSNLKKWDPDYKDPEQAILSSVDNIKSDRTEFDLLYEIMLKYGIDLTLAIDEYEVNGKKIYSVGFGALFICLDDEITSEIATKVIDLKDELSPETVRVVFKDNGFLSDSDKTNIKETLKNGGIDEFITI
ncbi:MAG: adenine-specific DNA-methyltransferase [Methanobrevibacter sp. CfCl-M3]